MEPVFEGGGVPLTAKAAALLGSWGLWFPKLSDSVSSSVKWLTVVRVAVRISQLSENSIHLSCAVWLRNCLGVGGMWLGTLATKGARP